MAALVCAKDYYGEAFAGLSIPASEHSTMTSWGREKECDAMRNMLEKYPQGLVACVSDSFDVFQACEKYWGTELKSLIDGRNGTLVVRPDSGELPGIVLQVLEKLEGKFGHEKTSTGHKVLPPQIRVIQGDGIDINSLAMILQAMKDANWAADNLAFGSGGALLQKLHRDTQKCAFKCSYAMVQGKGVDVEKDPITDPGKKSKKGRLTLECADGQWKTITAGKGSEEKDELVEIFCNGILLLDESLQKIRDRSNGKREQPIPKPMKQAVPGSTFNNIVMLTDSYKMTTADADDLKKKVEDLRAVTTGDIDDLEMVKQKLKDLQEASWKVTQQAYQSADSGESGGESKEEKPKDEKDSKFEEKEKK